MYLQSLQFSPDSKRHWVDKWLKDKESAVVKYMPIWSYEELQCCRAVTVPTDKEAELYKLEGESDVSVCYDESEAQC